MKPPISRAKMMSVTKAAIKAIKVNSPFLKTNLQSTFQPSNVKQNVAHKKRGSSIGIKTYIRKCNFFFCVCVSFISFINMLSRLWKSLSKRYVPLT